MKRKTIEEICKKHGVPLAPDDDPRYSEPWSITFFSHTPTSQAPSGIESVPTATPQQTKSRKSEERTTESQVEHMEIYTCYAKDDADSFRSIKGRAMGPWTFLVSGKWSQSPYHQGNCRFYIRRSQDRHYWALLSVGFPSRIIAVACTDQSVTHECAGGRMLKASRLAGGDYIEGYDDFGDFDVDRFTDIYES